VEGPTTTEGEPCLTENGGIEIRAGSPGTRAVALPDGRRVAWSTVSLPAPGAPPSTPQSDSPSLGGSGSLLLAFLAAAFLLLLSPLIFISGDMAPGNLDSISVTVLVDDKPVTAEPAPVPERTGTPKDTIPTTDPLDPDTEHTNYKTGPSYASESEGDDAVETGDTLSGIPGDDPALSRYITRVRTKIERRKYYPASSRRTKEEGTVTVSFLLTSAGDLVTQAPVFRISTTPHWMRSGRLPPTPRFPRPWEQHAWR
jgi:outer membrane biosynthesis protein TonB